MPPSLLINKVKDKLYRKRSLLQIEGDVKSIYSTVTVSCDICGYLKQTKVKDVLKSPKCPLCRLNPTTNFVAFLLYNNRVKFIIDAELSDGIVFSFHLPNLKTVIDLEKLEIYGRTYGLGEKDKTDLMGKVEENMEKKIQYCATNGLNLIQIDSKMEHSISKLLFINNVILEIVR